jgi:hypothetical protein
MRSIPGTITSYTEHADQVDLLDLSPADRAAKIKANKIAEAQRIANDAAAELRRLEAEG